jgi:hypothetical protein
MFEIDECIGWPELLSDFLPSDNFPGAAQQHFKNQVRLTTKFYFRPAFYELTRTGAHFERTKAIFFPIPQSDSPALGPYKLGPNFTAGGPVSEPQQNK